MYSSIYQETANLSTNINPSSLLGSNYSNKIAMCQLKGALIVGVILALTSIHSISACEDYQDRLCFYVSSTRTGTVGHGWSCSTGADVLIVNIDGRDQYYHCKYRQQFAAALQGEDIPKPPPPSSEETKEGESDNKSQLVARILSALGLEDTASAQSCNFNGQRLCLYIRAGSQSQWYCNDQSDVNRLEVSYNGMRVLSCK